MFGPCLVAAAPAQTAGPGGSRIKILVEKDAFDSTVVVFAMRCMVSQNLSMGSHSVSQQESRHRHQDSRICHRNSRQRQSERSTWPDRIDGNLKVSGRRREVGEFSL
jgi:hypothetical protein